MQSIFILYSVYDDREAFQHIEFVSAHADKASAETKARSLPLRSAFGEKRTEPVVVFWDSPETKGLDEAWDFIIEKVQLEPSLVLQEPVLPFKRELERLINRYSRESDSNTPDFILASFLQHSLNTFDSHVHWRDRWYGNRSLLGPGNSDPAVDGGDASVAEPPDNKFSAPPVEATVPSPTPAVSVDFLHELDKFLGRHGATLTGGKITYSSGWVPPDVTASLFKEP